MRVRCAPIVTLVVAAASIARADGVDLVPKVGFRIGYGAMPIGARSVSATSLEVGVEHPVVGNTRVFGEWAWLWLSERDPDAAMGVGRADAPMTHGSGQLVSVGLRRAVITSRMRELGWYLDAEGGSGVMLVSEDALGTRAIPEGLVGLRVGLDLRKGNSSSRVFETELLARAIILPHGYGVMFGVGMLWGD